MRAVKAELVQDARAELGEGPIWDARSDELLWVDITAGVVHRFDPRTATDRPFTAGSYVGAVVPRASGGYALAVADGFAAATADGDVTTVASVGHGADIRMNDGACDAAGRFWAGSMHLDERAGAGCLYRLDPDGAVTTICDGVTVSNGIGWSPDDTLMYYVDTPLERVDVFDYDGATGNVSNRRPLFAVEGPGSPDGLVVDAEGCLWVAFWDGFAVRRYAPDGRLVDVVEVPAGRVTKPAFGGAGLADLYITSAAGPGEHAGGLFVAEPGARGLPPRSYAG
ncbi:MAG TPA: SMP-30/gluconolactonase/LRE family protein [Gaiellaceae bacterium]